MKLLARLTWIFALLPSAVFAHGQQVFALPAGQGMSLLAIVLAAGAIRMSTTRRIFFIVVPILVIAGSWFVPSMPGLIGATFDSSSLPWFLLGILPPLLSASLVYVISQKWRSQVRGPKKSVR